MEVKTSKRGDTDIEIKRKENSKVYFFIIAIAALLLTNVYFYVKFKSSGEKLYTIALQKEKLQIEIDRIEAELDNIQNVRRFNAVESEDIVQGERKIRTMIANLRANLEESNLSEGQLGKLEQEIFALKGSVSSMKAKIEELKLQNEILRKQNQQLNTSVNTQTDKVQTLEENNKVLREKMGVASSIKVSNIVVNGIDIKRRGGKEIETRAKRVNELQIQFSVADNPLATLGEKDVYIRVVDPNGNLVANANNTFLVNNDELQFTAKEKITFTNNGEEYEFTWTNNNQGFKKGAYTVLLYADGAIMGRSSIVLK
ncbi:MAG TPA: hypothetical protein PKA53_00415 [Sphingobacterium sp.]|nr:hypothetical protein [Sphingobacterium sp.]